jgi:DNA-binding transcriptional MerR regulator
MDKSEDAFRTISEAAEELDVPQHVLRFWETRFTHIRPMKRGGGRRYYRPADMALLHAIRRLLYGEGYTIKGVQRILKEQGVRAVVAGATGGSSAAAEHDEDAPVSTSTGTAAINSSSINSSTLRDALADLREARDILRAARGV